MPDPQTVRMISPDGNLQDISADSVAMALQRGFKVESLDQQLERQNAAAREARYGGVGGAAGAIAGGLARGGTFGLSDVAAKAFGMDETIHGYKEQNPGLSTGAEIVGALATAIPSGGESLAALGAKGAGKAALKLGEGAAIEDAGSAIGSHIAADLFGEGAANVGERAVMATPAGITSHIGERVAESVAGLGGSSKAGRIIGDVAGKAAGGAVEGSLYGAGGYVSDVALGDKDASAEGFLAAMGHGAMWGGAAGGALAIGEKGLVAARRLFPKQEMTQVAVDKAATTARETVGEAVTDADNAVQTARQRMRDLREQMAAQDLGTQVELDAIAKRKAQELADAQVALAKQKVETEAARTERVKAGGKRTRKAMQATDEAAPAAPAPEAGPASMPAAPAVEADAQSLLERQLAGTKARLDQGKTLADIGKERPPAIGLKPTAVEDALNEHVGKTIPEVDQLQRAVAEVEDSQDAVKRWLGKYGGQGNVGRFERGQAARDVAESWRPKEAGWYTRVPEGEGNARLPRGREGVFRGSEADRAAADEAVNARVQGRAQIDEDVARMFGKDAGKSLDDRLGEALGKHTEDIDIDVSDLADAVGRMENAHAGLAEALGPAAPPGMQVRAEGLRAAQQSADQATATAVADHAAQIDRATTAAKAAPPAAKSGLVSKLGKAGDMLETLHLLGAAVPDPGKIPVIGPILQTVLRARIMAKAFGRFGGKVEATAETAIAGKAAATKQRVISAVDKMLGAGAKGAAIVAPAAPPIGAILGHRLFDDGTPADKVPKGDVLAAFNARAKELAAATPDSIRTAVQDKIRASDPRIVDAIAQAQTRALAFLQSKIPKPDAPDGMLGGLPWQPSKLQLAEFSQYVEAVHDPAAVLELAAKGGVPSPMAVETLKAVYPTLFAEAQRHAIETVSDGKTQLPYARRLQMSMLFDLPLDRAMDPVHAAWLAHADAGSPMGGGAMPGAPTMHADVTLGQRSDPHAKA